MRARMYRAASEAMAARARVVVCLGLIVVARSLALPAVLHAQSGRSWPESAACLAAIPAESMQRVTVYLAADASDSAARPLLNNVSVLTQAVAVRVRALLGAQPEQLPRGEPTLTWRDADASVEVTAYRDGRLRWRPVPDSERTPTSILIERALTDVHATGGAWFVWPDSTIDSLVFRFVARAPIVDHEHTVRVPPMQGGMPLFSVAEPWEESTRAKHLPHVPYPPSLESARVEGVVILRFIVDTTGRVDTATISDVWPSNRPRLTGDDAQYYDTFVKAVRTTLVKARFEPARIGGCPVRQLVQMPFGFRLR